MRPILMKGHERPLTFLKYNRDGDMLFSCAKDHNPTVWFADNGERLGTYRGHNGAVWCCDISRDSLRLITGLWISLWVTNLLLLQLIPSWNCLLEFISNALLETPVTTGKLLKEVDKEIGHKKAITSLAKSADGSHFLTGSLDKSAKLWDTRSLSLIKTYVTERPVNAVAMSPLLDHVVIGGGQDASAVTTTDHRAGKFEAKFFDKILQEEIGGVKGHFGPINALAFNPDGKSFSSGGEDGYVRLHHFDPDYFNIKI
ncbi:uncharacterized protein LOC129296227 isoform X2 [Prosopis cineraria]|uniref:uncharacterized protein LOC129296227 isoform X2 n=1 Tax=Prosopis cineraria TaxID=364024 RepID=UPI00240EB234|nr:uncharacterized protein LOC129296227 isoform X2 [Prosopis cineraria]